MDTRREGRWMNRAREHKKVRRDDGWTRDYLYITQYWGSKSQEQERGGWSPGCLAKGEGKVKL